MHQRYNFTNDKYRNKPLSYDFEQAGSQALDLKTNQQLTTSQTSWILRSLQFSIVSPQNSSYISVSFSFNSMLFYAAILCLCWLCCGSLMSIDDVDDGGSEVMICMYKL